MPAPLPADSHTSSTDASSMRALRTASLLEGGTLLALVGIAVPLKHIAHLPLAVSVLGPVHGMAVLAYLWLVVSTVSGGGWSAGEITRILLAAMVPGGAFLNAGFLRRKHAALQAGLPH